MTTITNHDIRDHVVIPALGEFVTDYDIDGIVSEILAAFPLSEWAYSELQFTHEDLFPHAFWAIVESHDKTIVSED